MKNALMLISIAVFASLSLLATGCSSESAMSRRDAKPTMGERMSMSNESVKGRVVQTEGDYVWIKEEGGKDVRVHVDNRTKMDKVVPGDRVKAYVEDGGHATTLQRLE